MDDKERLRRFVNGSNGIPELMLLLLILTSGIFSVLWIFILPVVGMLYMLGYLT